ncbi:rhodanese-like domain-containing protein [Pimelobacter simplex]|nr:rhodanese-like domain-containing protein [Pimelobacter simplex]
MGQALAQARGSLNRLTALEALEAQRSGALLVDVRRDDQRERFGAPPDSLPIDLTILEWRLDPTSPWRISVAGPRTRPIVLCQQGYSSSLAAARLQSLGLSFATDVIGGFDAWVQTGLPLAEVLPVRIL